MAFEGGPLSTLGITPEFVNTLAQQTASTGVTQALGQIWQGAGQSFIGQAGQSLAGNLAGSAVNVVINSALGSQISGPGGFPINTGGNFLASTVTPFVTSSLAAGVNQNIQQALQSAGPFGTVLSGVATGLVGQVFNGLTGGIANLGGVGSQGTNYKMFPGGGGEPEADYGGKSYTLDDVVFSLKRANVGPQSEGDAQAVNSPTTATTVGVGEVAGADNMVGVPDPASPAANYTKQTILPEPNIPSYEGFGSEDRKYLGTNSTEFLQKPDALIGDLNSDLKALEAAGVSRNDIKYIIKDGDEKPWTNTPFNEIKFPVTGYIDKYGRRQNLPVNPIRSSTSGPPLF